MKALSIKEPWASMIYNGIKSVEIRTWKTDYRGDLLLCASKNPVGKLSGKAFAIVCLYDIRKMVKEDEYRSKVKFDPIFYSWFFKDVRLIDQFIVKGKLRLFNVDYSLNNSFDLF